MNSISVDVSLYGSIARYANGNHIASLNLDLPKNATFGELLQKLGIKADEKGYVFINAVLSDAPGLNASLEEVLKDKDHIGIFSITHMWPYQYRDGVKMSESLRRAMAEKGAMHNSYRDPTG